MMAVVWVLVTQSCLTLFDPMDYSPPDSSVHGILQARILEWVAMPSSRMDLPYPGVKPGSPALQAGSLPLSYLRRPQNLSQFSSVQSLSRVRLFATPWTVACQTPLIMEFSRQEYWSGLPFPSPGYLLDPGIERRSPACIAGRFFTN